MINYECDPAILNARLPRGTELDFWNNKTFVSMVGFQFLQTRILGMPVPFHCNFEEVNLRFYVRRKVDGEWRRGVVFVRELVPRAAIAWVARTVYEEPYLAVPMAHRITQSENSVSAVEYTWIHNNHSQSLSMEVEEEAHPLAPGSQSEFIAEHYWGYTARKNGRTSEYEVVHPPWQVQEAKHSALDCDIASLYGEDFVAPLSEPPASAFLALGSEISVHQGTPVHP